MTDLPSLCVMSAMKGFGQFRKVRTGAQEDTCSFSIDCLPCIEQTKEMRARRTGTSFDKRRAKRFSNYRREHSGSHHHVTKHEPSITSPPQNKFLSTTLVGDVRYSKVLRIATSWTKDAITKKKKKQVADKQPLRTALTWSFSGGDVNQWQLSAFCFLHSSQFFLQ